MCLSKRRKADYCDMLLKGRFAVRSISLKSMSFDGLVELRDRADRLIKQQAAGQKRALEDRLAKLSMYVDGAGRTRKSSLKGRKAPVKFRNPENRSETWAGRGATPRWLRALLEQGRKIEEFAVRKAGRGRPKGTRKARRKKAR